MSLNVWYDPITHLVRFSREGLDDNVGKFEARTSQDIFSFLPPEDTAGRIIIINGNSFVLNQPFENFCDRNGNPLGSTQQEVIDALNDIFNGPENVGFERYLGTIGQAPATHQSWPAAKAGDFVVALDSSTIDGVQLRQGHQYRCTMHETPANTPDNWEEQPEPQIPAGIVAQQLTPENLSDNVLARSEQITQLDTHQGHLIASTLKTRNNNGIRSTEQQKTRDVIWSDGATGSRVANGTNTFIAWNLNAPSSGTVEAVGLTASPNSNNRIQNVKMRVRDNNNNILAYSPSQEAWDEENAPGLNFNHNAPEAEIFLPLNQSFNAAAGETYNIQVRWTDGELFHADDSSLAPTYRTIAQIQEGSPVELATMDDVANATVDGISSANNLITFENPTRNNSRILSIANNVSDISLKGGILSYRGQEFDAIVPYIDPFDGAESQTRTLHRRQADTFTVFGNGTPLNITGREFTIDVSDFPQSLLQRIRVTQAGNGPAIPGCNLQIRMVISNTRRTIFDLEQDTGNTFTLEAGGTTTNVVNLTTQSRIPIISQRNADDETADVRFVIVVPEGSGSGLQLENPSDGNGVLLANINRVSINDLVERQAPVVLVYNGTNPRTTNVPESNRNRFANRLIDFQGSGDQTFSMAPEMFRNGTKIEFRNSGTGTVTIQLNGSDTFLNDSNSVTLAFGDYRSYVINGNDWALASEASDSDATPALTSELQDWAFTNNTDDLPFNRIALNAVEVNEGTHLITDDNWSELRGGVIRLTGSGRINFQTASIPQADDVITVFNDTGAASMVELANSNTINGSNSYSIPFQLRVTFRSTGNRTWETQTPERVVLGVDIPQNTRSRNLAPTLRPGPAEPSTWAAEGNTDPIPADKLTNAGGGGLNEAEVDARIADWAETNNTDVIPSAKTGVVTPIETLVRHANFGQSGTSAIFEIPNNTLETKFIFDDVRLGGSSSSFRNVWATFRGATVSSGTDSINSYSTNYRLVNKTFQTAGSSNASGESQVGGTNVNQVTISTRMAGNDRFSGELIVYGDRTNTDNIKAVGRFTYADAFGQISFTQLGVVVNDRNGPTHVQFLSVSGITGGTITQYRRARP